MSKIHSITHEFVEFVPDALELGVLYISVPYKTMAHLCCCGCGKKVVTPISPTGWEFTFNGRTVSVSPSVGNWNLECQSHYVISNSRVDWADQWSKEMIAAGFARDQQIKQAYYKKSPLNGQPAEVPVTPTRHSAPEQAPQRPKTGRGLLESIKAWWIGK